MMETSRNKIENERFEYSEPQNQSNEFLSELETPDSSENIKQ